MIKEGRVAQIQHDLGRTDMLRNIYLGRVQSDDDHEVLAHTEESINTLVAELGASAVLWHEAVIGGHVITTDSSEFFGPRSVDRSSTGGCSIGEYLVLASHEALPIDDRKNGFALLGITLDAGSDRVIQLRSEGVHEVVGFDSSSTFCTVAFWADVMNMQPRS